MKKNFFYQLLDFLTTRERYQALVLFTMMTLMAILDVMGVASIMPFMAVISNPQIIETNILLSKIYTALDYSSYDDFITFLGKVVFIVLVVSLSFKALTNYVQLRYSMMREYSIGRRLVESYLGKPYVWFLDQHSADLGKNILSETINVVGNAINPFLTLVSNVIVSFTLIALLIIVDYELALVVGGVLLSSYWALYSLLNKLIIRVGKRRFRANEERFKALTEIFGGVKELKVGGHEESFIRKFSKPSLSHAKNHSLLMVISSTPRHALEMIAFGGILLILLYLRSSGNGMDEVLPIVTLYALSAYRLMPAVQQIFASIVAIRSTIPSIESLHNDLELLQHNKKISEKKSKNIIDFKESIVLSNVNFKYPDSEFLSLKNINIIIPAGNKIGLIGASGGGKSTLVDLILGLLEPSQGVLKVDNVVIHQKHIRLWQNIVGYVPQQIYLLDDTIAANIGFGQDNNELDMPLVEESARIANLHNFIINDLPMGYLTKVGERGVRLSGGQRQRIGIARVLYSRPKVLFLDEATSALDNITEKLVMRNLYSIQEITIVTIAHRLSTIKECDCIYIFNNGRVVDQGSFDELSDNSKIFQEMNSNL
jgi:ATP-binding cassette, subfamily B, bacterial PglK